MWRSQSCKIIPLNKNTQNKGGPFREEIKQHVPNFLKLAYLLLLSVGSLVHENSDGLCRFPKEEK